MEFPRCAGILLHPTSLPGRFGIGDLGPDAHRWVDWLGDSGQRLWQVLPLGPTGFGDSPYQCFSAFAGNPLLVSPALLVTDGLLAERDLHDAPQGSEDRVDYGAVVQFKRRLLGRAFTHFRDRAAASQRAAFAEFVRSHAGWLEDYALFKSLQESHGGSPWTEWAPELVRREPGALQDARTRLADAIEGQRFQQFLFFRQWGSLREHANQRGLRIVGDIPIFVAHDSADVWAHPELFHVDELGRRVVVAGVPPDYFSETGQLWGNPLYRWDVLEHGGFSWWVERVRAALEQVDIVRLDHFRGFEAYWEVAADQPTAEVGRWMKGPGPKLFSALREELRDLPIIAEDLGVVTDEVIELREQFGLPGMKVLQFAFDGDPTDAFLPHNYTRHCVVYTGTHDNDTARGWYEESSTDKERDFARRYLGRDGNDVAWDLIRLGMASVAHTFIAPLQDVLNLGAETRLNLPGRASGNWGWRFRWDQLTAAVQARLRDLTEIYGRCEAPEARAGVPPES